MHALQNVAAASRMIMRDGHCQQDEPAQSRRRRWAVLAVLSAAQFRP
jgi:hypothetical protein